MEIREYGDDQQEMLRSALEGHLRQVWTSFPAIVSEDSDGKTVKAQPAVKGRQMDVKGVMQHVDLPELVDVPVQFPGGGGLTLTHPIKKGDEVMIMIASRAIDNWHDKSGTQQSLSVRMHSLSDAMAIPGLRSKPKAIPNISTEAAHIRTDDQKHYSEVHPQTGIKHVSNEHTVTVHPDDGVTLFSNDHTVHVHPDTGVTLTAGDFSINLSPTGGISMSGGPISMSISPTTGISIAGGLAGVPLSIASTVGKALGMQIMDNVMHLGKVSTNAVMTVGGPSNIVFAALDA